MTYQQELAALARISDMYREIRTASALLTETAVRLEALRVRANVSPETLDANEMDLVEPMRQAQQNLYAINMKLAELNAAQPQEVAS